MTNYIIVDNGMLPLWIAQAFVSFVFFGMAVWILLEHEG